MKKYRTTVLELLTFLIVICMGLAGAWFVYHSLDETEHQTADIRKTIDDIGTYDIDENDLTIRIDVSFNQRDYPYWYGSIPEDYLTMDSFKSEALNQSDESAKTIIFDRYNQIVYFPVKIGSGWIQVSAHAVS